MKLTRDLPSHLHGELQAEQLRILRTQIPLLYAVLTINTGILCFSVYGFVSNILSLIVPSLFALIVVSRVLVWLTRRRKAASAEQVNQYLKSTTIIASIVSLVLGLWGVVLLRSEVSGELFVPLFITFGAIACAYCLSSLPRAAFATIVLATTPVVGAMLASHIRVQEVAGVNLLLIFILTLRVISHQYNYLVDKVVAHSQLKDLAESDALTGLPNRRAFIDGLERIVLGSVEVSSKAAVAMIDLDGFKAINDTYGHAAGDAVLVQAALRIQKACRSCQMVARLGGDEFAVLIIGESDDALVAEIGAALVQELGKPFVVLGSPLRLTASIGFATLEADDDSVLAVMSRADVALYEVKHGGGEGGLLFAPAMGERLQRRMMIEQALREINPRPRIQVVYQPIFDARTMQITSFEALARWSHPELGPVNPLEFIGVAEQTGTIAALSEQIFATAIEDAAGWIAPIGLSINLSAIELCRPSTPLMILSLCHRYGLDPRRLEVEVTETSVLSDFDAARRQLELLRSSGIRVALDDFGSGFASIAYLKQITFDRLKIDGELVTDIIGSPKARRLVQGILQLCTAIGLPATAEKVESKEQMAVLIGLGCDRLQGYLLSKPVTANAARETATISRQVA